MIVTNIILAFCLIISGFIGLVSGLAYDISVEQALEYLDECQGTHQYYVNHPESCNATLGSPEFHQKWVVRYQQIKKLIKELE